jgi:hypothetical protein
MHFLSVSSYCFAVLSIVAFGFLIANFVPYWAKRRGHQLSSANSGPGFPIKSAGIFVGAVLLTMFVVSTLTSLSRQDVLEFVNDSRELKVYVNSQPAANSEEIIAAVKTLQSMAAHHSHPTKRIRIEFHSEKGVVTIECGRDSANAQEYWVFYPKYSMTSDTEIGRITTAALDAY